MTSWSKLVAGATVFFRFFNFDDPRHNLDVDGERRECLESCEFPQFPHREFSLLRVVDARGPGGRISSS